MTVRFGKLGSSGQEQTKTFDSAEAATKELAKLVKQKLAKGYTDDAWTFTFDSGLGCYEMVDRPLPVPGDASLAHEDAKMKSGSWSELFWHGAYVFALEKTGSEYHAGVIDQSGGGRVWHRAKPAIVGASFPYGFDDERQRLMVATAKGAAFVVDCKTAAATEVAPAGDDITAAALGRDFAALLRKKGKAVRLELYDANANWKLTHTLPCGRNDALFAFGGRGLMVTWEKGDEAWDGKSWPSTHFIGLDGRPRLLGTFGLDFSYGYTLAGRTYFKNDSRGLLEIRGLDEALAKTAKDVVLEALVDE
jgi:hypothetical protein